MKRKSRLFLAFLFIITALLATSACGGGTSGGGGSRGSTGDFVVPEASGEVTYGSGSVSIDDSNTSDGYVMIKYSGSASKIKIQMTGPDSAVYTYTSKSGDYQTFPLSAGNGSYKIDVLENVGGDMYTLASSQSIDVSIDDEFSPFLYPNQYVWFTKDMKAMDLGKELSEKSSDDLSFVENVYEYVIKNVTYDNAKAANVPVDYIPSIDETLETGQGICFDYASLMAAMLRAQGVPTKLVVGYSGTTYHAWINVYTEETGWVDKIIEFDGKNWSLMDPTLGASNDPKAVKEYVNNDSNYQVKYNY